MGFRATQKRMIGTTIQITIPGVRGHQEIYLLVRALKARFMRLFLQAVGLFYLQVVIVGDLIKKPLKNIRWKIEYGLVNPETMFLE